MKLVEILAKHIPNWIDGCSHVVQVEDKTLRAFVNYCNEGGDWFRGGELSELAQDWDTAEVTRAEWEAERARIALEVSIELASGRELDSKTELQRKEGESDQGFRARILLESQPERDADFEKVVDGVAARSAEDQALWDKVYFRAWELIAMDERELEYIMRAAANAADAFMAERAKRMKL